MFNSDVFIVTKRRPVTVLNLVPILDMLTTIIFFLLISVSFMEYNKVTVPPSRNVTISNTVTPPPLQARMLWLQTSAEQQLVFTWFGAKPGKKIEKFPLDTDPKIVAQSALAMTQTFKAENLDEKTILIGLDSSQSYEKMIMLMDAVKASLPDISLISYAQADAALQSGGK